MIFKIKLLFNYFLFRIINPNVKFNGIIIFNSNILFKADKKSDISIGKNCIFSNNSKHNYAGIDRKCCIRVKKFGQLKIGNNCGFSGTVINVKEKVIIGNYVQFGVNVNVWDNDFHSIDFVERRKNIGIKSQPVVIDDDVWIGANSTILKGVHIGKGSVIASNSLVNKNVGQNELWGGVPARKIKDINA